jgi:hypothetical protein
LRKNGEKNSLLFQRFTYCGAYCALPKIMPEYQYLSWLSNSRSRLKRASYPILHEIHIHVNQVIRCNKKMLRRQMKAIWIFKASEVKVIDSYLDLLVEDICCCMCRPHHWKSKLVLTCSQPHRMPIRRRCYTIIQLMYSMVS